MNDREALLVFSKENLPLFEQEIRLEFVSEKFVLLNWSPIILHFLKRKGNVKEKERDEKENVKSE